MEIGKRLNRHGRTCRKRSRYRTQEDAAEKAAQYMERVVLSSLETYYCLRHRCWHNGHATWNKTRKLYSKGDKEPTCTTTTATGESKTTP